MLSKDRGQCRLVGRETEAFVGGHHAGRELHPFSHVRLDTPKVRDRHPKKQETTLVTDGVLESPQAF
jgi:hypothetical protein